MHYHWVWEIDYLSGKETCPNNNKIKEAKFIFSPQLIEHLKDKKLKSKKKNKSKLYNPLSLFVESQMNLNQSKMYCHRISWVMKQKMNYGKPKEIEHEINRGNIIYKMGNT